MPASTPAAAQPAKSPIEESPITRKADLKFVHPDELVFDLKNPRFGGLVKTNSQEEIQKALIGGPYFADELIDSLLANGFIDYEPLVVRKTGKHYTVIEGNRRLAAIREIRSNLDKYKERKSDLDKIPVLVFSPEGDADQAAEMRVYLGVRHLIGFREWPPLSKAAFLEREIKESGSLDDVIRQIRGLKKAQARRFLVPYRLLRKAKIAFPPEDDFSVLGEALGRDGIKTFIHLKVDSDELEIESYNKSRLLKLLEFLYGKGGSKKRDPKTRIVTDTRSLSRLARVLESEKSSKALLSGKPLEEAEIYIDSLEESVKRLQKLTKSLGLLLKKIVPRQPNDTERAMVETHKKFDGLVKVYSKGK